MSGTPLGGWKPSAGEKAKKQLRPERESIFLARSRSHLHHFLLKSPNRRREVAKPTT